MLYSVEAQVRSTIVIALSIKIVVLDEAIIIVYRLGKRTSAVRRALRRTASSSLLRNSVACIDPVSIHVDWRRQIYPSSAAFHRQRRTPHTIDVSLKRLPADLALQVADTGLLLDGNGDGFLVVAEEALKRRWQLLLLV